MSISEPFIRKPVATTLLTIALALAGAIAFRLLPVSPLPQVEFPTFRSRRICPVRVRKRWLRRWRLRSSASSAASRV